MAPPYYDYDTLPSGYIRLIRLLSTTSSQNLQNDVEVSIVTVPLDTAPRYVCLSYTWNHAISYPPQPTEAFTDVIRCYPINCGKSILLASRNLKNALMRIQQAQSLGTYAIVDHNNLYWADALCIDQDNLDERAAQVAIMASIYGNAISTFVWLGEEDVYSNQATEVVLNLNRDYDSWCADKYRSSVPKPGIFNIGTCPDKDVIALVIFFARTWFSRTWILQEIILSKTVQVLYGGQSFPFDWIFGCSLILLATKQVEAITRRLCTDSCKQHVSAFDPRIFGKLSIIWECRQRQLKGERSDIQRVITLLMGSHSRETRDRVYGVLGFAEGLRAANVIPDYRKPLARVFVDATCVLIQHSRDLRIFSYIFYDAQKDTAGLPSWCYDFGTNVAPLKHGFDHYRTWTTAALFKNLPVHNVIGRKLLEVDGIHLDDIVETCDIKHGAEEPANGYGAASPLKLATKIQVSDPADPYRSGYNSRTDVLWRTIFTDEFAGKCPAPPSTAFFLGPTLVEALQSGTRMRPHFNTDRLLSEWFDPELEEVLHSMSEFYKALVGLINLEPDSSIHLPSCTAVRKTMEGILEVDQKDLAWKFDEEMEQLNRLEKILIVPKVRVNNLTAQFERDLDVDLRATGDIDAIVYEDALNRFLREESRMMLEARIRELYNQNMTSVWSRLNIHGRFFLTSGRSLFGQGQPCLRATDQIWFLNGASAPVALRPAFDSDGNINGKFIFLGEVYVHGYMHGEFAKEIDELKLKERRILLQ